MGNVVSFTHVSLDGYVANDEGAMDWLTYTGEIADDAYALSRSAGAALYGRTTYQMMEGYWPTVLVNPDSSSEDRGHAEWVENIPKVVFSHTLDNVTWNNTTLIKDNLIEEVSKLKQQIADDLLIFGSPRLTYSLAQLGLIDEYRINLNPIAIGQGLPLFEEGQPPIKLSLSESRTFACGVIALRYAVVR